MPLTLILFLERCSTYDLLKIFTNIQNIESRTIFSKYTCYLILESCNNFTSNNKILLTRSLNIKYFSVKNSKKTVFHVCMHDIIFVHQIYVTARNKLEIEGLSLILHPASSNIPALLLCYARVSLLFNPGHRV